MVLLPVSFIIETIDDLLCKRFEEFINVRRASNLVMDVCSRQSVRRVFLRRNVDYNIKNKIAAQVFLLHKQ